MDPTAHVKRVMFGYIQTQCLVAATSLGVPDALEAGPKSIEALSAEVGAPIGTLGRLLDALIKLGLFTRTDDGRYAHNPASVCLCSGHENSLADLLLFCGRESYATFANLTKSVREDVGVFADAWGQSFWQHLQQNPDRGAMFGRAMERQSEQLLQRLVQVVDLSDYGHIVDVGGGKGQLFRPLAAAGLDFEGTVLDLPALTPLAEGFLADEGLVQCRFQAGDFFEAVPGDGDLYVLKFVLHDWTDADCLRILKTVRAAMRPDARLMIIELVRGAGMSPWSHLSDMLMLSTFGAMERSLPEFEALLTAAGFALDADVTIADAHHAIIARVG